MRLCGCSACEHARRRHAAGRRLPRPMEPQPVAGPRRRREHPPVAVSTATNPSWMPPPSEVKVTVIVDALTLSRAGRSAPLNCFKKASVPLPR